MPNRILRDWTDSFMVDELDVHAERFFVRLIMKVDDFGRFSADKRLLKSQLFPLKSDIRDTDISRCLTACEKAGLITIYTVASKSYLQIENFKQTLRQKTTKYPSPDECIADATHMISNSEAIASLKRNETETEKKEEMKIELPEGNCPVPFISGIPTEVIDQPDIIDFDKLLKTINKETGRHFQVINDKVKKSFRARIKSGYTKETILKAIRNAAKSEYHRGTNCQYLTPEFFSRVDTLDKWGTDVAVNIPEVVNNEKNISGPWHS